SLTVQFGKHADFRPQELRNNRNRNVVHSTPLVPLEAVEIGQMYSGNKNDRSSLKSRMLTDNFGEFKAVNFGHGHIHKDDSHIGFQENLEGLPPRIGLEQVLAEFHEHDFVSQQFRRLIIHHEDVDLFGLIHRDFPFTSAVKLQATISGATTCVVPTIT